MNIFEFIQKFDELFSKDFEYECDEYLGRITLFHNKKLNIPLDYLSVEFDEDSYSLFRDFVYTDSDGPLLSLETNKKEILFTESMKKILGCEPERSYEDGMGCPFFSNQIGFFNKPLSTDNLQNELELISQAYQQVDEISLSDVSHITNTYHWFEEQKADLFERLKKCAPSLCHTHIKDSPLNVDNKYDSLSSYLNRFGTILLGVGTDTLLKLVDSLTRDVLTYNGVRYFIAKSNTQISVFAQNYVDEVINAFAQIDEECDIDSIVHYSLDRKSMLVVHCGELWALICPISSESHARAFTDEKNRIKKLEQDFISVAPVDFWNRSFDFSSLNDQQFETFCRDLLSAMNFKNIHVRGKSHAADGGVDITAEEEYQTLIGSEKRIWIFQCKHTKQQVSRKDISEVRDLLREFNANCYGLFYSGFFTPATLDRIKQISETDHIIIKGWDHNDLELELAKYPSLSAKYFGI